MVDSRHCKERESTNRCARLYAGARNGLEAEKRTFSLAGKDAQTTSNMDDDIASFDDASWRRSLVVETGVGLKSERHVFVV